MALPRAKVKPAAPAFEEAEAPERRATRAELESKAAIVDVLDYILGGESIMDSNYVEGKREGEKGSREL